MKNRMQREISENNDVDIFQNRVNIIPDNIQKEFSKLIKYFNKINY